MSATGEGMKGWVDGWCLVLGIFEEVSKESFRERRVRNVIKATFDICNWLFKTNLHQTFWPHPKMQSL